MANLAEIFGYLEAISYPADKTEILNTAIEHDATDEVIETLRNIPEQSYNSANELGEVLESEGIS